jgi:hypothetical protein
MPRPKTVCALCGADCPTQALWPLGPICRACYRARREHPGACTRCGHVRILVAVDGGGEGLCGPCGGGPDYACPRCDTGEPTYADGLCARCALHARAVTALTGPDGNVPTMLQPLADAIAAGRKPASGLTWLGKPTVAAALHSLTTTPNQLTHETIDQLDGNTRHLRSLLVAAGILPARDEELERLTAWTRTVMRDRPAAHVMLVRPFVQWVILRRARQQSCDRPLTRGAVDGWKSRVVQPLRFLAWLDTVSTTLAMADQGHIERWLQDGPTTRYALRPFITWARSRGLAGDLNVPPLPVGDPKSRHSAEDQWRQLRTCIHDTALPTDVRVAGGLLLLFGIRITVLARLRRDQVTVSPTGTHLTVAQHELLIPPRLARLLATVADGTATRTARSARINSVNDGWLFPGQRPGSHLTPEHLAGRLRSHGIGVRPGRNTALAELAADLPTPVLADLVGIGITTALRWARHAQRDWAPYLAARADVNARRV